MANLDIVYEPVYNSETHKKEAVTPLTDEEIRDLATSQSGLVIYESNFQLWDTLPDGEDFRTLIRALLKYSHEFEVEALHATDTKMDALLNAMYRAALPAIDANFKKLAVFTAKQKTRGRLGGKTRGSMKAIKGTKQETNNKTLTIGEVDCSDDEELRRMFHLSYSAFGTVICDKIRAVKRDSPAVPVSEIQKRIDNHLQERKGVADDYELEDLFHRFGDDLKRLSKAYAKRTA